MGTTANRPKGWLEYVLAVDCETTGLVFSSDHPTFNPKTGERHQTVSWGMIVLRADTLEQVDELYVEIKWNDESKRQRQKNPKHGVYAEGIHGLTYDYLEKNGVDEEEAIEMMWAMLGKYWSLESLFCLLGHNVHLFDLDFFKDLFHRHGIKLKFGSRHIDSHSAGFAAFNTCNSDQLFELIGFDARDDHNALDDIKMAVASVKAVRDIVQGAING